jgi:hypothetical protein
LTPETLFLGGRFSATIRRNPPPARSGAYQSFTICCAKAAEFQRANGTLKEHARFVNMNEGLRVVQKTIINIVSLKLLPTMMFYAPAVLTSP